MIRNNKRLGRLLACMLAMVSIAGMTLNPVFASSEQKQSAVTTESWNWNNVNLQGMGWVTGLAVQRTDPYLMYARTDVGGAYRYDRENDKWIPITDSFGLDNRGAYNIESIAIDPSHEDNVYIASNGTAAMGGEVYKSADRGATWIPTGLAARNVYMGGNDDYRQDTGERLAVDPNHSDDIYFGSRFNGLWRKSGDGEWEKLGGGLPQETCGGVKKDTTCAGVTFVVFDKGSGVNAASRTNIFYIGVYDDGVYKTTDGGETFVKMAGPESGSDVRPYRGAVNSNGMFFVTANGKDKGAVLRSARAANTLEVSLDVAGRQDTAASTLGGLDTDPANPNIVAAQVTDAGVNNPKASLFYSTDEGATWSLKSENISQTPSYYPTWWANHERGALAIDPVHPNSAWTVTGFGVLKIGDLTAGSLDLQMHMNGLEETVVQTVLTPPLAGGYDVHIGTMDTAGFSVRDRSVVPEHRLMEKPYDSDPPSAPTWGVTLNQITGMDYSYQHPENMVYVGWHQFGYYTNHALYFGTTNDGGRTWNEQMLPQPDQGAAAGAIAMSSSNPDNLVWSPAQGYVKYSTDRGKTWTDVSAPFKEDNNFNNLYERMNIWWATQNLAADKVNGSKFYLFTERNANTAELWMSADGGKTWNKTYTGYVATQTLPNGDLDIAGDQGPIDQVNAAALPFMNVKVNPAREGDVFLAVEPGMFGDDRSLVYRPLYRSTSKDVTDFKAVPNVQAATQIAFGKGDYPDQPYIYIFGKANGDQESGVYRSRDNGNTWERITDPAKQQFGIATTLEADMRYKNRVYIGTGGRGVIVGEPVDLPEVKVTGIQSDDKLDGTVYNGNVLKSGAKVTVKAEASAKSGAIAKVEFYRGADKLGEVTSAPYQIQIDHASPGDYAIVAKAIDSEGREQYSPPVDFKVIDEVSVGSVEWTNDEGKKIDQLPATETVHIDLNVTNHKNAPVKVNMEAALYEGQTLVDAATISRPAASGEAEKLGISMRTGANADGQSLKVFVWTGEDPSSGIVPVALLNGKNAGTPTDPKPDPKPDPKSDPVPTPVVAQPAASPSMADSGSAVKPKPQQQGTTAITLPKPKANGKEVIASLSSAEAAKAVEQAKSDGSKTLALEVPKVDGAAHISVQLPAQWLRQSGTASMERIVIRTQLADISVDPSIISRSIDANAQQAAFSVSLADELSLQQNVRSTGASKPVYDFGASIDGHEMGKVEGVHAISYAIPYSLIPGEKEHLIVVYEIGDRGELSVTTNGKYDGPAGKVTFATNHFGRFTFTGVQVAFNDLSRVLWAKTAIEGLAAREIVNGMEQGEFAPDHIVTRAQYLKMLMSALNLIDPSAKASFSDTKKGQWDYAAIASAQRLGIAQGREDGTFGAKDPVTRQDMAILAMRALDKAGVKLEKSTAATVFADQDAIAAYAQEAVSAMQQAGIIEGSDQGLFEPGAGATRAEAAKIVYSLMNLL